MPDFSDITGCHVNSFIHRFLNNLDKDMDNAATNHGVVLSISYLSKIVRNILALTALWHQSSTTTYSRAF